MKPILICRYCGSSLPLEILSTSDQLTVKFITDQSIQHTGFLAVYETCKSEEDNVFWS